MASTMQERIDLLMNSDRLTPTQKQAGREILSLLTPGKNVYIGQGHNGIGLHIREHGLGVSTLLRELRNITGGVVIDALSVLAVSRLRHPRQWEESAHEAINRAIDGADFVYIDALPFGNSRYYFRKEMIVTVLNSLSERLRAEGKCGVSTGVGFRGAVPVNLLGLQVDDFAHIFADRLGADAVSDVNFLAVFETASRANAHDVVKACDSLRGFRGDRLSTMDAVQAMASAIDVKVNLDDVEELTFDSLKGFEGILRKLDRSVLMPIREPELAKKLGIKPKRGVLLHGPPGTGKTSIGRALAHQMQGRFFMISGEVKHDAKFCFYKSTTAIFAAAKKSAPSVIFIDDADIILSDPRMQQWGRFLLTKLDGMHSQGAEQVCVMMTAMNLRDMPEALLRSGRLEVWLETTLPDARTRDEIMRGHIARLPVPQDNLDLAEAVDLTDGFTPADLRGVVSSAAGLLAHDRYLGKEALAFPAYVVQAIGELKHRHAVAADHGLVYN